MRESPPPPYVHTCTGGRERRGHGRGAEKIAFVAREREYVNFCHAHERVCARESYRERK